MEKKKTEFFIETVADMSELAGVLASNAVFAGKKIIRYVNDLWKKIHDAILEVYNNTTFDDLMKQGKAHIPPCVTSVQSKTCQKTRKTKSEDKSGVRF